MCFEIYSLVFIIIYFLLFFPFILHSRSAVSFKRQDRFKNFGAQVQ